MHGSVAYHDPAGARQVFTSRTDNVGHHRTIQAAVRAAVSHALQLATRLDGPQASVTATQPALQPSAPVPSSLSSTAGHNSIGERSGSNGSGPASFSAAGDGSGPQQRAPGMPLPPLPGAPQPPYALRLHALSLSGFQLPLAAAVTTGAGGATRSGLLLEVQWQAAGGRHGTSYGEISPLPGAQP